MKKTILALMLCAALAAPLAGCGERTEPFPPTATPTSMTGSTTTAYARGKTNADNGAYNGSFGNTGSTPNPSPISNTDRVLGRHRARRLIRDRDLTWEQMVDNGRVHDRDGYLLDGENSAW